MPKEFRIYRANKTNNGFATAWQFSYKENEKFDKYMIFLVGAAQTGTDTNGNASFDWKGGITVKLGENDLGEILSVIEGRKESVGYQGKGLFHQTEKGNKIISFAASDNGFNLKISAQDNDKNKKEVRQVIGLHEASILSVLLKRAIERIYGWD